MTNYRQNQKQRYISLRGDTVGIISSIYNSGYNIKRLFLGEQELKLAYLGERIVFNEVIDDLNYVLYEFHKGKIISNTIEAPVKSAILKGNTLVNISPLSGEITIVPNSVQFIESSFIKQNTTFTFIFNCTSAPSTGIIGFRQMLDNATLK